MRIKWPFCNVVIIDYLTVDYYILSIK
jgi:hypothetical protein